MRFSLSLPMQHPIGDDLTQRFAELLEMVRLARQAGFSHVSASQHYLAAPFQYMQPLPVLARVAAETGEMTLGTGIMLLALQQPVDVAESIATLDVICGGRLVFGVGLGYRDVEFDAFGIPRGQRLSRFLEALEIVKRLWTEERVTFHGTHFHLQDVSLTMRPVQKPRPPIVVAASNDKMVQRVARIADAWTIAGHATLATLERQVGLYRAALEAEGKPFPPARFGLGKELYIARDMDTALREACRISRPSTKPTRSGARIASCRPARRFICPSSNCGRIGSSSATRRTASNRSRGIRSVWASSRWVCLHWPGMPHQRVMQAIDCSASTSCRTFREQP
jgi:alkanesulfonate monooxygenase SsuD/methylene tetrahydromethanopterin reductase-like flavin-dependent oxidoreductase (luciferase family)